jgi:DNA polymerase-3 subunit delta
VREGASLEGEPEALTDFAGAPPPEAYLIVRAPSLDLRRKLHKALAESGRTLHFPRPGDADPRARLEEVRALAAERGLKLQPGALALLAEVSLGDLYRAASELDKLALLHGSGATVTLEQTREVAAGTGLLSGWEVADALLARDRAAALAAVRRLVDGGDEPIRIVGGLAWRARTLLRAKALAEQGAPAASVIREARAWGYREALLAGLGRYTLRELASFPAHLLEADRALKSRALGGRAVLEALVDRLIGAGSAG